MEQRTDEWIGIRLGKFTSSKLSVIAEAVKKKDDKYIFSPTQGTYTYLEQKLAERLTGEIEDTPNTFDMQRGIDLEPVAIQEFCDLTGIVGSTPGFIVYNDYCGGSPDFLGFEGEAKVGAEIKCPKQHTHVKYVTKINSIKDLRSINKDYYWQVISIMLFTNTDTWYWISYHPSFPTKNLHYIKVTKEDVADEIERLKFGLDEAAKLIEEMKSCFQP